MMLCPCERMAFLLIVVEFKGKQEFIVLFLQLLCRIIFKIKFKKLSVLYNYNVIWIINKEGKGKKV